MTEAPRWIHIDRSTTRHHVMVNRGRSGGCVTCKKRRVKCDEEMPECRRCRNRDVVCEGYVKKPIDLKFKDQSRKFGTAPCSPRNLPSPVRRLSEPVQGVVSLHNRTSTPNVQDQRNRHSGKAIERQSGAARTNTKLNQAQDELITSVPRPLAQIDVAVPFFLTHYASLGRDVQSARGYFEMLIPVYTSQQQDSALVLAISAVASEILSLWRHRSNSFKSPRVPYARAVARVRQAVQNPIERCEPATVFAVLALQLYENIAAVYRLRSTTSIHQNGAAALLACTDVSKMDLTLREHIRRFMLHTERSLGLAAKIRMWYLRILPRCSIPLSLYVQALAEIRVETDKLDRQLSSWSQSVPDDWHPQRLSSGQDFDPSIPSHESVCEVYVSCPVADTWNLWRFQRMILLGIKLRSLVETLRITQAQDISQGVTHEFQSCRHIAQELVDGVCYSIPFYLGNRMNPVCISDFADLDILLPDYHLPQSKTTCDIVAHGYTFNVQDRDRRHHIISQGPWQAMNPLSRLLSILSDDHGQLLGTFIKPGQYEWICSQFVRVTKILHLPSVRRDDYKEVGGTWNCRVKTDPLEEIIAQILVASDNSGRSRTALLRYMPNATQCTDIIIAVGRDEDEMKRERQYSLSPSSLTASSSLGIPNGRHVLSVQAPSYLGRPPRVLFPSKDNTQTGTKFLDSDKSWSNATMMNQHSLLSLTATEAQKQLQKSAITAVDLVEACLDQIARHNHAGLHLNALISVAPRDKLIAAATKLDAERQAGRSKGPLHAIPIVLKDCILTSTQTLGLPTTLGCPCFAAATCLQNSPLVDRLLDAGLLIIGKANLTELCGLKMRPNTPGWSAHGGQTQNPYIFGGLEKNGKFIGNSSAGGSSSGSGASVASGFAPLALGTQTGGSVILPANRAGLYALVCGHGTVPTQGNYCLSQEIDCVGAMAKSALDVNQLASVIMGKEIPFELEEDCSFRGMRVGFLDPKVWHLPGNDYCNFPGDTRLQIETAFIEASIKIDSLGANIRNDLELSLPGKNFEIQGKSLGYEHCMQRLQSGDFTAFAAQYQDSEVRTLEQMVAWNADHSKISMPLDHPCQDELIDLLNNTSTPGEGQEWRCELMKQGKAGLDPLLFIPQQQVSFLYLADHINIGYPIACAPLGMMAYSEENQRPFGLCLVASRGGEHTLLRFLRAFELTFPPRPLPQPLL
ncbi:amidase signature enzyme, partial [Aureobasidium melanogenum]